MDPCDSHPESHLIDSVCITATFCSGAAFSEASGAGAGGASTMAVFLDAPGWWTHWASHMCCPFYSNCINITSSPVHKWSPCKFDVFTCEISVDAVCTGSRWERRRNRGIRGPNHTPKNCKCLFSELARRNLLRVIYFLRKSFPNVKTGT